MTEVDQRFAALEGKLNGLRSAGSVSDIGSSASTRAPRSIVPFVANWAEVKDFVISHKTRQGALTSNQHLEFVAYVNHELDGVAHELIDWEKTEAEAKKRVLYTKVLLSGDEEYDTDSDEEEVEALLEEYERAAKRARVCDLQHSRGPWGHDSITFAKPGKSILKTSPLQMFFAKSLEDDREVTFGDIPYVKIYDIPAVGKGRRTPPRGTPL